MLGSHVVKLLLARTEKAFFSFNSLDPLAVKFREKVREELEKIYKYQEKDVFKFTNEQSFINESIKQSVELDIKNVELEYFDVWFDFYLLGFLVRAIGPIYKLAIQDDLIEVWARRPRAALWARL